MLMQTKTDGRVIECETKAPFLRNAQNLITAGHQRKKGLIIKGKGRKKRECGLGRVKPRRETGPFANKNGAREGFSKGKGTGREKETPTFSSQSS